MKKSFQSHDLFELNFDIVGTVGNSKAFNISAIVSSGRLELLEHAETPETLTNIIPYSVKEILEGAGNDALSEIMAAQDPLTETYGNAICGMVGMILHQDSLLREHFPEGRFHYKANSLEKITLQ